MKRGKFLNRKRFVFNKDLWDLGKYYNCIWSEGRLFADIQDKNSYLERAVYFSAPLDSREKETVWGRMKLDFETVGDSYITISYFATDSKKIQVEGIEIDIWDLIQDETYHLADKLSFFNRYWADEKKNTPDLLLSKAKGRFLWFKLEFYCFHGIPPCVKEMEIEYPFESIMEYLPAFYRENKHNHDFLSRFLGIYQSLIYDLQDQIETVSSYFDPDYVEDKFLLWLSEWVSADIPVSWKKEKIQKFIKISFSLYKEKGTKKGLERLIEFYTGKKPIIIEAWEIKEQSDPSVYCESYQPLYKDDIYSFFVLIEETCIHTLEDFEMVKQLVEKYKPAYTNAIVILLKQCIVLGQYSYLGINTRFSEDLELKIGNNAALPFSSESLKQGGIL